MIYFVSDLHGKQNIDGLQEYLRIGTENDILIILGDVCLDFFQDMEKNKKFCEYFLSLKKNIAFLDGNHENFTYLKTFPQERWNGGIVRRLTEYIVYLERGNIYHIDGESFFVFGGCKSSEKWAQQGLWYREETASEEECKYAIKNLENHGLHVDYILTHKYEEDENSPLTDKNLYNLTQYIERNITYKKWYFGHRHVEERIDEKH